MSDSNLDFMYFMSQLAQATYSLRVEMVIFVAAFAAHALLFGKYRFLSPKSNKPQMPQSPPKDVKVSKTAEDISKFTAGKPEVTAANLRSLIADVSPEDLETTLISLIQSAGRIPTVEFLTVVNEVVKEHSLPLNGAIGEMMLRGYYACHLTSEFDTLLAGIEAEAAAKGERLADSVGVQALKSSLRKGDFEASLSRLTGLRGMWDKDADSSPSAAPKALLSWLSRLSLQQDCLPTLLQKLKELGLAEEVFALILAECGQQGSSTTVREAEALGRKEGVKINNAAYCALVKAADDIDYAMRLFSETLESNGPNKELIIAATSAALAHQSKIFADTILQSLPADGVPEAACKLLQLYARSAADDAEVLRLYMQHFSEVDLSNDTPTEYLIAEACLRLDRLDVLKQMLNKTTDSTKRVSLLKQVGAANLDHAFVIFHAFPEKGACLYNAVIDACIDGKRPDAAQEVMQQAIDAGVADTVTYNTIIKAHLLAGRESDAKKTVRLMKAAGLEPNCVTFNELLDAAIKHKDGNFWIVWEEMQACRVKPNHITGSILLKTIRSNSPVASVERVLQVLDSIADEMDEVLLSSVVEACIRAGRVDLLMPHLKRQTSKKKVQVHGPHTYGSIIRAYGFVNDIASAWDTWREMRKNRIVPTAVTVGCMVEAVVSNGNPEEGYELIHDMLKDDQCKPLINAVIYCSVLKGFSHQKKFSRLWEVYQEMRKLNLQFSIVTWNTMVDACSRCGEMRKIPDIVEKMVSEGIEPNLITYSAILKGYCQENRIEEAFALMDTCKERFKPDEIMYNTLLDGCARKGMYERGMTTLAEMERAGIPPTNFTLSVLVKLCSRAKMLDRAFTIVDEIAAKYKFRLNVHVYDNLIQACIQQNQLGRAFDVLDRLLNERVRPDTRTYSLLLKGCVAAGQAQDAAGLMRAASGLRGVHPRLMGYSGNVLQPQGGLPSALISEILEGMAQTCGEDWLAVALLNDLRTKHKGKIDPKLQMRLTTNAAAGMHAARH